MENQTQSGETAPKPPNPPAMQVVESVVIRFCGDSGDGMQLTGTEFTRASALALNDLATLPDYPAEIRAPAGTLFGVSGYQIHFGSQEVYTPGDQPDVLVAMNPAALKTNLPDLVPGGILIVNTGAFGQKNLELAGYSSNPLEDGGLDKKYRLIQIDISKLTGLAVEGSGLGNKDAGRCKNFWALGLMFWMYQRETERELRSIQEKFAKKPELAEANIRAFKGGYSYGENTELFAQTYHVRPAKIEPGLYRNVTGNSATALGIVCAGQLAELPVFFGGYPITPASDILHELSSFLNYGVTTFQAEDEIAGVGSTIGAAYAGSLGVTATSGPGVSLKQEAIGLAVMLELPMVIVNVQRGGPSTGLPTKTEQADLLQAIYGRHGECPVPVLAAMTPSDCFFAVIEAARIAIKYMTPVFVLTDGYLANGSEPWKVPELSSLPKFPVQFRTDPNGYQVYGRDPETLARAWVRPGTPGLEHRIGGIEKHNLTGNISYDPENHHQMVKTRAAKVAGVAVEAGELITCGPPEGDLLVVGWGSTYGAITQAVQTMQTKGHKVTSVHLRWLNPLNPRLAAYLKGFKRVLVPEMNNGQLVRILRAEYLVDAEGLNKIQGKPFKVAELCQAIAERCPGGQK
ncbi:MAG TPA: 2-oxoacid:acceptor oxidoreductase subunit alpha [Pseudomonadota bacterium]|jgi:2-oxoglutarate ferredoxin oxidoreductase subunit alpha|nr:2-oxoacid:acceptor oxidoreductase subunit alpha [Pseudomonadota bacterium]HNF97841.1 2-oxoacid:acceptor oxidoreductase subunit alpha [Pseudomonadota bacterium]HNK43727.1 2-oxoacid:acceptor oxidoreductase subunit alpha [Pseudomonadota bacterium]HNN51053.1 2-oxoacid:acceptor oxidoreductase subunit alpha [Pseudomonadota bacterium]